MSTIPELQIHTVYSEADAPINRAPSLRLRALALLTVAVSACWLYATWKPVWSWIEHEVMIGGVILTTMGTQPATAANATDNRKQHNKPSNPKTRGAQTQSAQTRLVVTTVGWLALATFAGLWLAMGGCAGIFGGRGMRRLGLVGAPLILIGIGVLIWYVNREYGWLESILPRWVRPAIAGLTFGFAAMMGLALHRWRVGLLRLGGVIVVLSAVFSVAALWATLRWGGIPADKLGATNYAKVFAVQSAYGWLLLLGTIRLRS